jgi:hypothetical protein
MDTKEIDKRENKTKIEFLVREEDLLETQMLIAFTSGTLRKRRWIGTISVLVCLLIFCLYLSSHVQSPGLFKIVIAIMISVFVSGLYFFLIPYIYRKHYINQIKIHFTNIIGNLVELQIINDYIETRDKTGETKVKLTAIKQVYETGNLFIIQSCNDKYITIAKRDIDFVPFRNSLLARGLKLQMIGK